jgi:hypothetical protein
MNLHPKFCIINDLWPKDRSFFMPFWICILQNYKGKQQVNYPIFIYWEFISISVSYIWWNKIMKLLSWQWFWRKLSDWGVELTWFQFNVMRWNIVHKLWLILEKKCDSHNSFCMAINLVDHLSLSSVSFLSVLKGFCMNFLHNKIVWAQTFSKKVG